MLFSYGPNFSPFEEFVSGLRKGLTRLSPTPVEFFEASLETARFPETRTEAPLADYLSALFDESGIDVVISIGGPAARFCLTYRSRLFPSVPLLRFSKVKSAPAVFGSKSSSSLRRHSGSRGPLARPSEHIDIIPLMLNIPLFTQRPSLRSMASKSASLLQGRWRAPARPLPGIQSCQRDHPQSRPEPEFGRGSFDIHALTLLSVLPLVPGQKCARAMGWRSTIASSSGAFPAHTERFSVS